MDKESLSPIALKMARRNDSMDSTMVVQVLIVSHEILLDMQEPQNPCKKMSQSR